MSVKGRKRGKRMKINNLDDFITPKQAFGKIPDVADISGYDSPIQAIASQIEMSMDGEILKACQRVGVDVNKEELIKALNYDRGQYDKGFQAGYDKAKQDMTNLIDQIQSLITNIQGLGETT